MTFHLYNTLTRKKDPFTSLKKGEVSFYTCGPTVYNYAHIGNFRAYLASDTLRRWLQSGHSYKVKWVLNITDVDDKTIRDSKEKHPKEPPKDALLKFTRYYEDIFFEDLKQLNIQKSDFYKNPRATDYIDEMQDLIRKIAEAGFAKEIEGSIFFDVKKWAETDTYGKLLNLDLSGFKSGMRTLADEIEKDDAADFALWKAEKKGEPSWGFDYFGKNLPGRPGWHLECSAMEKEIFDLPFDIHSGGVDLIFPHHEDEIAQSKCGYGIEPTQYWMHNEHLLVEGKKMSKSLGNFYTLRDLLEKGHSAEAIRFFLVSSHYRTKVNLSEESLTASKNALQNIRNKLQILKEGENSNSRMQRNEEIQKELENPEGEDGDPRQKNPEMQKKLNLLIQTRKEKFTAAMNDDLNTSAAIAQLHELLTEIFQKKLTGIDFSPVINFFEWASHIFGVKFCRRATKSILALLP